MEFSATTVTDVVDALHTGDRQKVTAASLGRLWQHVQDLDTQSFGIMTSWRAGRTPTENKALFAKLKQELRMRNLGFIRLIGHWLECQDTGVPYSECPSDKLVDSTEPSLFIPEVSLKILHKLANKYDQDACIYGGPDTKGHVTLVFRNGHKQALGSAFSPKVLAQGYSELGHGRKFSFITYGADSAMESVAASVYEKAMYKKVLYNSVSGGVVLTK